MAEGDAPRQVIPEPGLPPRGDDVPVSPLDLTVRGVGFIRVDISGSPYPRISILRCEAGPSGEVGVIGWASLTPKEAAKVVAVASVLLEAKGLVAIEEINSYRDALKGRLGIQDREAEGG